MSAWWGIAAASAIVMGVTDVDARSRPARDPDIAVQEELRAARAKATAAAYDLFIARHPRHKLAAIARKERAAAVRKAEQR